MAPPSSRRKGGGDAASTPDLLAPLSPAGQEETTPSPDIGRILEAIESLKALITVPTETIGAETVAASIDALRSGIREHDDRNAESARHIRETLAAIGETIGDLATRLEAASDRADPALGDGKPGDSRTSDLLEAQATALQEMRNAVNKLTRAVEASQTEIAGLRHALNQADSPRSALQALDAWRDDFTRHVKALLTRAEKEAGGPAISENASQETALAHVDRIAARMALVESEIGKAALRVDEAFGAVVNTLKQHGESIRRNENSNLLARKGVESLRTAFDGQEREYRRLRHLWVSLPVILVVTLAGMVLESQLHWLYRLLG